MQVTKCEAFLGRIITPSDVQGEKGKWDKLKLGDTLE